MGYLKLYSKIRFAALMLPVAVALSACELPNTGLSGIPMPKPTTTPRPSATPISTPRPTATPTPVPTATPRPTATPTPVPTATPRPTATPTPVPTATPRPTATPTPVPTATPRPTATPTPTPADASIPIGYAAMDGITTGGAGGQTVTVTSLAALKSAAGSSSPMIIFVSGTITGTGSIVVRSNKSIIGLTGATLNGVGLRLFGTSTSDYVQNIIIKNLKIKDVLATDPATGGGDNDAIGLKWADHVWVDHCELSADVNHSDWEYYDGLVDVSKQSDHVTISWTKFSNSYKGSGVGGSSDAGLGRLRVTYHHNLFENIGERAPGYGYGTGHIFNNYFLKSATESGYSVGSRLGAVVLVENNYFENVHNPIRTEIEDPPGYVGGLDTNIFRNSDEVKVTTAPSHFVPAYEYKSVLTAAGDVPSVVMAGAGQK